MPGEFFDAIVIGGGPGGSAAATYLARANRRVLVLEKEHFPRFHVGESLLPYNQEIFREMGVLPALEAAGFPKKLGAQFHLGNSSKSLKLVFSNGQFTRERTAFQVERATFDDLLLKHARASGAEAREGWTVTRFKHERDHVSVEARSDAGENARFQARFLVDASGRGNLTGNLDGVRVNHPRLKKISVFGHFEGVKLDDGPSGGDTVIIRLEDKWFWLIPVSPTRTSIGCVLDQEEFIRAKESPADAFARIWKSSSEMRRRMNDSRLVTDLQTTADFSYRNNRITGPRLLRVGDAAGFMDPIFSSGVYLAMYSGKLAAQAINRAVRTDGNANRELKCYEKRVGGAMDLYLELVEGFYTEPFMELFMEPRDKFNLPDALVAILAGELEGGWKLRWRLRLFFWLVRAQARVGLVPGINFADA